MTVQQSEPDHAPHVGAMLRDWRERRRLSQLALAEAAEISTRHLSYVENGRSRPTAEMILRLAEQLEVPLGEQDRLLRAGGFAPRFDRQHLDQGSLEAVMDGLRELLDAHLPNPALLLDSRWDVVDANAAVLALLDGCHPSLLEPPMNALRISLHPDGLAPRITNLDSWAEHLLRQVTNRAHRTHDRALAELAAELAEYVEPTPTRLRPTTSPVLTIDLDSRAGHLRLFTVTAQLETPNDSLLEGLHLETFMPADEATRVILRGPAGSAPEAG